MPPFTERSITAEEFERQYAAAALSEAGNTNTSPEPAE
jgi:hypothetical protein